MEVGSLSSIPFVFGNEFATYIKSVIPGAKEASGGREIVCRCRYCTDSAHMDHGHMYIKVPQHKNDPILFHCFKCQTSGILDSRTLMEWNIYDPHIGTSIDKIISNASKNSNLVLNNRTWFRFVNHIDDYSLAQTKLDYINNRLKINLTFRDCLDQKIILNLKEAVDYNRVESYTRHLNIMNQFNKYFLGFLSLDNNFVNMRRLCDDGIVYSTIDRRYINYNIFGKQDNTEKMYIMPTTLDLSIPQKVQIHIAEGPFDILSIRYNLRQNDNSVNTIYAAITGSGYKGLVIHLISTFKIFYFDLHVYPDNDSHGSKYMIQELVDIIRPYGAILYEHRNARSNEKDFGVSLDRIDERVYVYK